MRWKRWLATSILVLLGALGLAETAMAADPVDGKNGKVTFDGVLWAAYRYTLQDADPTNNLKKDLNAFTIDRVYLTFSSQLADKITGRARIEMSNQNDGSGTALAGSATGIQTFLKSADVTFSDPFGAKGSKLRFGQTDGLITPWYEAKWAYRVVQKVTTDRYLGVSSTYVGAGWYGKWADGVAETDVLVANRSSFNSDASSAGAANSKFKLMGARTYFKPIKEGQAKGLGFGGYAQMSPRTEPASDNRDLWYGGQAYFEGSPLNLGFQYDSKVARTSAKGVTSVIISGFARYKFADTYEVFGRVDNVKFDKDNSDYKQANGTVTSTVTDSKLAQTVFIGGLTHWYSKTLRSIVDVQARTFQGKIINTAANNAEIKPDTEIIVTAHLDAAL